MKYKIIGLVMLFLGVCFAQAPAASLRDRVLSDVTISGTEQEVVIHVSFNFPVRYLRHYPLEFGKELNIQLDPIVAGGEELAGLKKRESFSAPDDNPAGLVRVDYEGSDLIKPTVRILLDRNRNYDVRQGEDFRSLMVVLSREGEDEAGREIASPTRVTTGPQEPGTMSAQRQEELRSQGEAAMAAKEYMRAILIYTELLDAPDPAARELAQFELATAREYKEHLAHARAEYKNYLETYPEGRHAEQARARLKALMGDRPIWLGTTEDIAAEGPPEYEYFGSASVYYDRDESMYEDGEEVENLSSLTTGFDATWRSRSDTFAVEAVAIGSYELSFLDDRDDLTRVNRFYIDLKDAGENFVSRVGRQSSSKGGVLTRFDGAQLGYLLTEKVRANLVAGFPVNLPYDDLETDRYFYGVNFDLGRFAGHWDFNTYIINQIADDVDDRRAVGAEGRYIGRNGSFYSLLDFDILYDEVSVFLFTGNYLLPNDRTRINVLADFRGVPLLSKHQQCIDRPGFPFAGRAGGIPRRG
ncbi:MAG TPA: hypothetical protein ENN06_04160 [Desulfobacteraceae bacterium]|nr:hypothetical protein [Desulfobacteraceae bacterium]